MILNERTVLLMFFLQGARVTGHAQPFSIQVNLRIRESPVVIKGLAFVEPFGVVDAGNHGDVVVQENALVTVRHDAGCVGRVFIVGQELGLGHEGSIIVGADEGVGHQSVQRFGVVMQLGLIPGILEGKQQALAAAGRFSGTLSAG